MPSPRKSPADRPWRTGAATGGLPLLGHVIQLWRRPLEFLASLPAHGDLVELRLGPGRAYLAAHPELVRHILLSPNDFDKGGIFDKARQLLGNSLSVSRGDEHRRQRRMIQPAFHTPRIAEYTNAVGADTRSMTDGWRPGEVRDIGDTMQALLMRVAARTLFSTGLDESTVEEARQCLKTISRGLYRRTIAPLGVVDRLPTPGNREYAHANTRLRAIVAEMIARQRREERERGVERASEEREGGADRRAECPHGDGPRGDGAEQDSARGPGAAEDRACEHGAAETGAAGNSAREHRAGGPGAGDGDESGGDDLLSVLLRARHPDTGARLSDREILDQVITFLVAGSETTAATLAFVFHLLGTAPEIEKRVHAEIDASLGGRPPRHADLPTLPYTRNVITEALRLYPPSWMAMRVAARDTELGGRPIPAGTMIFYSAYAIHRNPEIFPDPDAFDPDRWEGERAAQVPRGALLPFGAGVHKCIGDVLALTETALIVATVAARWRLRPVSGTRLRPEPRATLEPGPLPMICERR
ncbi:cytochrome P450 [Streptomyces sp. NPDC014894]|uniref:cytochrome P450 n=1 Tax=Streptomyces sp. NPDC014894 TaxID=3364931 RepID=UPI0036F64C20